MYSATFIFATKHFDAEFHRLDQQIAAMAKQMPGYLGEETCENHEAGLTSNVYYWESQETIQELMQHPGHLKAESEQANWLAGCQVVISQVVRMYGGSSMTASLSQQPPDPPST